MPLAKWKCVNLGNCTLAGKEIELEADAHEPICRECRCPLLRVGGTTKSSKKLILLGLVATLVIAGVILQFWHSSPLTSDKSSVPVITSAVIAVASVGRPFDYAIQVNDPKAEVEVAGLPDWLRFDSATHLLTGTPSAPGKTELAVTARNTAGSDRQTLQVSVIAAPPDQAKPPGRKRRKILIPVQATDTNLTLELETDQLVSAVRVRLNSGVERTLENHDVESSELTLTPFNTDEKLYEIITQINDNPPEVHRFAAYRERRMHVWVEGFNSAVVAAERVGVALLAQDGSRIKDDPRVLNALNFWTNKYAQELKLLPDLDVPEGEAALQELFGRYAKQDRSQLLTIFRPLLNQHITSLRAKGVLPTNYVDDILTTYKSHPNLVKEPK